MRLLDLNLKYAASQDSVQLAEKASHFLPTLTYLPTGQPRNTMSLKPLPETGVGVGNTAEVMQLALI